VYITPFVERLVLSLERKRVAVMNGDSRDERTDAARWVE